MNNRLFNTLLIVFMLVTMILPVMVFDTPVLAKDPPNRKVRISPNTETEWTGNVREINGKKEYEYKATISAGPVVDPSSNRLIDTKWTQQGNKFVSGINLFSAEVNNGKVDINYQGNKYSYNPITLLNYQEIKPISGPVISNDTYNANYVGNTLVWNYGVFERRLRVIEGLISETYVFTSNPNANFAVILNKQKDANFIFEKKAFGNDANNMPISVGDDGINIIILKSEFDKAVYPVTIDPTSTFVTSASDGYMQSIDSGYANARNMSYGIGGGFTIYNANNNMFVGQQASYVLLRSCVYFDTTAISNTSNITSATLYLYGQTDSSTTDFNIQIQNGMPTYPHDPFVQGDFPLTNYAGNGGTLTSVGWSVAGYNALSLSASGISWINVDGITKFLLVSDRDIAAIVPVGTEYVSMYTYEKGAGFQPYLEITYFASSVPAVITNPASVITTQSARLNGYISADGGEDCPTGFYYGTNPAALDKFTGWSATNSTTGQSFNSDVTGLLLGTVYYYLASAYNTMGSSNGTQENFVTYSGFDPPSAFIAFPTQTVNGTKVLSPTIELNWVPGGGSYGTLVRYKIGDFPNSVTDGSLSFNGTSSSHQQSSLTAGYSYYFSAWSFDASGNYTATYVTDVATAVPYYPLSGVMGTDIQMSSNWFLTPDQSFIVNQPWTATINATWDKMNMNENVGWSMLAITVALAFTGVTSIPIIMAVGTSGLWFLLIMLVVFFGTGTYMHLIAGYITFLIVIVGLFFAWVFKG